MLEKGGREFIREGVFGGFIVFNGLLVLVVCLNDGMFLEVVIFVIVMVIIVFLLYVVYFEVVWNYEVCGD